VVPRTVHTPASTDKPAPVPLAKAPGSHNRAKTADALASATVSAMKTHARRSGLISTPGLQYDSDDVQVSAGLLERHEPARGRVVVHPPPGTRSPQASPTMCWARWAGR
jgi:hypothetical protein